MLTHRLLILTVGPPLLVAACYWLTMTGKPERLSAATYAASKPAVSAENGVDTQLSRLETACERTAARLAPRLNADCHIIIRAPFVLAGDLSESRLDANYRDTIVPTAKALSTCYFDNKPDQPITILMFATEQSYREHAGRLDDRQGVAYYGYYQKPARRVVLNIATGNGTLAHELTHTLAHFDFPNMPEWFDEGLASLYEQSEFSDDELTLQGVSNWRIYHLLHAIQRGNLRSLDSLIEAKTVRANQEAIDYAHARYVCLYLQNRGVLSHFYRKFRANVTEDPTGRQTLCELLQTDSLEPIDEDFRAWVVELQKTSHAR